MKENDSANDSAKIVLWKLGKRLIPPEGIPLKVGDYVKFEIICEDGRKGTLGTFVSEFDLNIP
jgi:hypothetical protein